MAGAYVQGTTLFDVDPVLTLTSVASGNALICVVYGPASAPTSVSSSNGGALTQIFSASSGGGSPLSVYAKFSVASGTHNVTVNNGGSGANAVLLECSGLSAYDTASTLKDGFSAGPNSNTVTPGAAGNYLLGVITNNNADNVNSMTTPTKRVDFTGSRGIAVGDQTAPSVTTYTVSGTFPGGSSFWYGLILSFTPSVVTRKIILAR